MPPTPSPAARALAWIERESVLVSICAISFLLIVLRLPQTLQQDTWLALLGGRVVADGTLPDLDHLTRWTEGVRWIDQQWLAQLLLYRLWDLGGIKLTLIAHVFISVGSLACALVVARRRGGSTRSVGLVVMVAFVPIVIAWQLRAQTFAYPLFVFLLALLLANERSPSRRVLLALPVLVLWANLHGSVLLGAGLVALYGSVMLAGRTSAALPRFRRRALGAALVCGSAACIVASPYGFSLVGYYRAIVLDSSFSQVVSEWQATTFSLVTLPAYVLGILTVWLLARHGSTTTTFERLTLIVVGLAALLTLRNVPWFGYTAVVLLPPILARELSVEERRPSARLARGIPVLAMGGAVVSAAVAVALPTSWYERAYPPGAARTVASAVAQDPSLQVFANVRYADWLLWREPSLAGRIAYDARLELLTQEQLTSLYVWTYRLGSQWQEAMRGSRLLVLGLPEDRPKEDSLLAEPGTRRLYRDQNVSVLLRA